jgi:hypothetical protein
LEACFAAKQLYDVDHFVNTLQVEWISKESTTAEKEFTDIRLESATIATRKRSIRLGRICTNGMDYKTDTCRMNRQLLILGNKKVNRAQSPMGNTQTY